MRHPMRWLLTPFAALAAAVALNATAVSVSGPAAEPLGGYPRPRPAMSAAELRLALRKLQVTASTLYIGAHPDDENTAMLSWLVSGRLVRTGYLSLTRGDGGQNLIGSETGEEL